MTILQRIRESASTYLYDVTKIRPIVELSDLSDHQLNDIGIPRDDLTARVNDDVDTAVPATLRESKFNLAMKLTEMYRVRNQSFE